MIPNEVYREELLEKLAETKYRGVLTNPDFQAKLANPLCGDSISIQIKVRSNRIEKIVYSGEGCALSQISACLIAEKLEGKLLNTAQQLDQKAVLDLLGVEIGNNRLKCFLLSLQVVKEALKK